MLFGNACADWFATLFTELMFASGTATFGFRWFCRGYYVPSLLFVIFRFGFLSHLQVISAFGVLWGGLNYI